ncbi:MAG: hypothetical protein OEQ39_08330 [Gammaproteobacteria bacterium]|nr:hypothetical protein [Gammaproteobacteria bacterium]MDH3467186.1 hypothetical protein [Gammaproteobacteria bacterium]
MKHLQIGMFIWDHSQVLIVLINNTTMMITVAFHPLLVLAEQVAVQR